MFMRKIVLGKETCCWVRNAFMLLLVLGLLIIASGCSARGSADLHKNTQADSVSGTLAKWNGGQNLELQWQAGDVIRVNILCPSGEVALTIRGSKGSEPYTGKGLSKTEFTVTVAQTDTYEIQLQGKNATGSISVERLIPPGD